MVAGNTRQWAVRPTPNEKMETMMEQQYVERMWLPTKGRLSRKVRHRRISATLYGLGSVIGFVYLVFDAPADV